MEANTAVSLGAENPSLGNWLRLHVPGLFLVVCAAAFAWGLSSRSGIPVMLLALGVGFALHRAVIDGSFQTGVDFAAKPIPRLGVVLLGAGVTADEIANLGLATIILGITCVGFTMLVGLLTAKLIGHNRYAGLLFGGAVAICGASAAMAIAAAMPQDEDSEANALFAVVGVTALSTVAMMLYPSVAVQLGMSDRIAGIFFGSTIHDVAQVVGAGYMLSDQVGETATIVKLLRVACLVPVVATIAYAMRPAKVPVSEDSAQAGQVPPLPLFLIGFVALSLIASVGLAPQDFMSGLTATGKILLVIAITAMGCKTSLASLCRIRVGPVIMLLVPTLALALFAIAILCTYPALFS